MVVKGNVEFNTIYNIRENFRIFESAHHFSKRCCQWRRTRYTEKGKLMRIDFSYCRDLRSLLPPLTWNRHKQNSVFYSAFNGGILAAADKDNRGYDVKMSLRYILENVKLRYEMFVDARAILDTLNTVQVPLEYRIRNTVTRNTGDCLS